MLPSFIISIVINAATSRKHDLLSELARGVVAPFIILVCVGIMVGAIAYIIMGIYLNETISARDALSKAWSKINNILAVQITYSMAIFIGFICFIIPGIYFLFRYALCVPTAVFEDYTGFNSTLERSKQLVGYNAWKVIAALISIFIITFLLYPVLAIALIVCSGLTGSFNIIDGEVLAVICKFIALVLAIPLYSIVTVVLYYDCRVVGEAYDLEVMSLEAQ